MTQDKRRQRGFSRRKFMQTRGGERRGGRAARCSAARRRPRRNQKAEPRPGRHPAERPDPHDGRGRHDRVFGGDQGRALHAGRARALAHPRRPQDARHRPARPHRGARHHRQPQPPRADGQPPRLPHAARERAFDRRGARDLRRARRRSPARAPGSPPSAASTSTTSTPTRRTRPTGRFPTLAELDSVTPNHPVFMSISFSGPSRHQQPRPLHPRGAGRRGRADRRPADGGISGAGGQSTRALLYLRQTLLNPAERRRGDDRRDEVRRQPRRDDAHRPGRLPGDEHRARRRGARRQLHDALPVPRGVRGGQGPGAAAHQLPAHGDRRRDARAACSA